MDEDFIKGVNLGGWLLLERWMSPSLFAGTDAVDEYTLMQQPGAARKIEKHRASFITEEGFTWLRDHGINAVRIPVGYWVLDGAWPYIKAQSQIDWAMDMAARYNIRVLIDVHGLPGSQNGKDHSGRAGRARWYSDAAYRMESMQRVVAIGQRYGRHPSLWGIQVINEPRLGLLHLRLRRYYRQVYAALAQVLDPQVAIIISDAFTPRLMSGALTASSHPVVLDVHLYHMSTPLARQRSVQWFMERTKRRQRLLARLSRTQPVIVGEWSGVISHETMRRVPREKRAELVARYISLQQQVYSQTAGWFYWSYKTEGSDVWNYRSQVEAGSIDTRMWGS